MSYDPGGRKIQVAVITISVVFFLILSWRSARKGAAAPAIVSAPVMVEVKGEVPKPGIYLLEGKRTTVSDALFAAGWSGNAPDGNRMLKSGESVNVGTARGEPALATGSMSAAARLSYGLKLDINSASEDDLLLVPQMRREVAAAIVRRRSEKPWTDVSELLEIPGVGPKTAGRIDDYLEVVFPLSEGAGGISPLAAVENPLTKAGTLKPCRRTGGEILSNGGTPQ